MTLEQLLNECLKFTKDGKPMFKALRLHSNNRWSADYRTWSKDKQSFSCWGGTPKIALEKLLQNINQH